jgi:hypothetical protein
VLAKSSLYHPCFSFNSESLRSNEIWEFSKERWFSLSSDEIYPSLKVWCEKGDRVWLHHATIFSTNFRSYSCVRFHSLNCYFRCLCGHL